MTMTLVETKTLVSNQALIEFLSVPQDATDLLMLLSLRTDRNLQGDGFYVRFNGSVSGYSQIRLIGDGSSVSTDYGAGSLMANAATATSNTFGNASFYLSNYTTTANKTYSNEGVSENNATTAFMGLNSGVWANSSAITSIAISPEGGTNFLTGSMISLYKITKGSGGATVS